MGSTYGIATPVLLQSSTVDTFGGFVRNLFTGALAGDMLSLFVVGVIVVLVLRFVAARWMYVLSKQLLVFGGLGYAVWFGSGWVGGEYGEQARLGALAAGAIVVGTLLWAMLYMFFKRRARERARAAAGRPGPEVDFEDAGPKTTADADTGTAKQAAAPAGDGEAMRATGTPTADHSHLEDVLSKLNVLGANKDQSILTVMVLILVAQFGVFTSKTIAAPDAQTGMIIAAAFGIGAFIFVKTSYKNYLRGVTHFVFATVFAVALSVLFLAYWQSEPDLTLAQALVPATYFASDGLIAAITAVAFSTLLTKGGG